VYANVDMLMLPNKPLLHNAVANAVATNATNVNANKDTWMLVLVYLLRTATTNLYNKRISMNAKGMRRKAQLRVK